MIKQVYKTKALIIRKRAMGETDKVLTLLTEDGRRVDVIASGARKTGNKYSGLLEPMVLVEVVLIEARTFDKLREARLLCDGRILEQGLKGLGLNCLLGEVLDKISRQNDNDYYKLIVDYLNCYQINKDILIDKAKMYLFASSFLMSVLAVSGRLPILEVCYKCGNKGWRGEIFLTAFGACHQDCAQEEVRKKMDVLENQWLLEVLRQSTGNLLLAKVTNKQAEKIFDNCYFLFRLYFEKEICSLNFLKDIYS